MVTNTIVIPILKVTSLDILSRDWIVSVVPTAAQEHAFQWSHILLNMTVVIMISVPNRQVSTNICVSKRMHTSFPINQRL